MLRVGKIDYANCTPIFSMLEELDDCCDYNYIAGVPSYLNQLLSQGQLDICPSSSIEYAINASRYLLLPDLSISSIGAVRSVLLISSLPLEELNNKTIGLTSESDTSVNLLKILLSKERGYSNLFERTDLLLPESLRNYPAVLLIGDNALKTWLSPERYHVYDLGELWYNFTGLPFVFALWIVTRQADCERHVELARLALALRTAKEKAYNSYADIAALHNKRTWISRQALADYWQTISYDLTPRHLEGLRLFYRYSAELGILKEVPELDFFNC